MTVQKSMISLYSSPSTDWVVLMCPKKIVLSPSESHQLPHGIEAKRLGRCLDIWSLFSSFSWLNTFSLNITCSVELQFSFQHHHCQSFKSSNFTSIGTEISSITIYGETLCITNKPIGMVFQNKKLVKDISLLSQKTFKNIPVEDYPDTSVSLGCEDS